MTFQALFEELVRLGGFYEYEHPTELVEYALAEFQTVITEAEASQIIDKLIEDEQELCRGVHDLHAPSRAGAMRFVRALNTNELPSLKNLTTAILTNTPA